MVILNDMNV